MSVSKNTIKRIGRCACLGEIMSQTHPISVCTGTIHARHVISSRYVLLQLEASVFKVTLGKKLDRKKASSVWNRANSNDIDSKRSSSRSFHGRYSHPRVTGFVHAFSLSFIPSNNFFNSLNSKGINWLLDALTWLLMRTQFVFRLLVFLFWFLLTWCFKLFVGLCASDFCLFVCLSFVCHYTRYEKVWFN